MNLHAEIQTALDEAYRQARLGGDTRCPEKYLGVLLLRQAWRRGTLLGEADRRADPRDRIVEEKNPSRAVVEECVREGTRHQAPGTSEGDRP